MKKIIMLLLATVMMTATAVGCNPVEEGDPAPTKFPVSMITLKPQVFVEATPEPQQTGTLPRTAGDALYADVIMYPSGNSQTDSYYSVITDYAEFERLFGDVSERAVNPYSEESFKISFVVAVYVTSNTGGWSYEVNKSINDGQTVSVNVVATPPALNTPVTQAFETHVILVCFDSADYYDDLAYNITVNDKAVELAGELALS